MQTYHLIDTENIPKQWFNLLDNPQSQDHVLLFRLSDSQKNYITLDELQDITSIGLHIEIIDCVHGKPKMNALDFQLISYVGYLLASDNCEKTIKIYSNDTGFEPAVEFWQRRNRFVTLIKAEEL